MTVRNTGSLFLALACLLAPAGAQAGTCTSQASGDWNSTATWTGCGGTGLPGNNDDVVISTGHTVTLNVNSPNVGTLVIQNGAALQGDGTGKILKVGKDGGTDVTNNGTLNLSGANAATLTLNKNAQFTGAGAWNLSTLDLNNKVLNFAAGTTATLNFSGAATPIAMAGTINSLATITFNFAGATAQTLPASANVKYGAITVNNSAGVTLGVALTTTSLLGNLAVQSGIFNDGGFAITGSAGATFSVANGATFNITNAAGMVTGFGTKTFGTTLPGCSTVNYALNGNQPVSAETYGHLILGSGGTKTPAAGTVTVACDLTLQAGVTYAGTTNNPAVNLGRHLVNGGTFNSGTGTFTFNGGVAQTVTGATTFTNMTLNNGNGLTINDNVTVATLLSFSNGRIATGANKLIIGTAGSHTGAGSARYVVGTMEKVGPVGTFSFAIGDSSDYTPVTTAFSAGGATGSLAVNTTAGEHPDIANSGLDPALDVNRYWTLTSTGLTGTYDATFTFVSGDKDPGSDDSAYEVMRYSGAWNATTAGTRTATTTQATGLTGFGDFAIGEILPPVDHWLIGHAGSMVSCWYADITFTAHTASHTAVDPDAGYAISISTTTGRGTWDAAVVAGNGTLSDPTPGNPDNGDATYVFPGAESAVTLRLRYTNPATDPELANFNVTDTNGKTEATGTAAADADDADLSVASAGFVYYNVTDANAVLPTQIAGKRSDTGYGAKSLALRGVRVSDSNPAVCTGRFPAGTDVTVELGAECRNPATCAGQQVSVTNNGNTSAIATANDNGGALTGSYTGVTLRFGADSTAELHLAYPDAGQIQLHARYDLGNPAGTYMTGSSNDFVVRPFGFRVAAAGNPAAADHNGAVYKAADEDFTVDVTAVGWQGADDGDSDGIPDGHAAADTDPANNADLSDNPALPNFGQESGGGDDVLLSAALYLPAGGADPGLAGGTTVTSFSVGAGSTATARYGEVGIIEIGAMVADGDYLGIGVAETARAGGKSGRVGRFRPWDFNVTGNTPAFAAACNADTTDFTYLEQPFDYATAPQITITARSKLGTTTANYDGDWWKLGDPMDPGDDITFTYAHDGGALPGGTTLDSGAATTGFNVDCTGGACNGAVSYTLSGPLSYTRTTTPAAPFASAVDITASNVTDSDGVTFAGNPFRFDNVGFSGGFNQQRWGRIVLGQAVGDPEIPLDVPVAAEYYDGAAFVQNGDDDCTTFSLADDIGLTNEGTPSPQPGNQPMAIGGGTTSVTSGDGELVNGADTMTFSQPGAGNTGFVEIILDLTTLTGADLPWLCFDWDNDGGFDTDVHGRASFGIQSRPEDLIFTREPW